MEVCPSVELSTATQPNNHFERGNSMKRTVAIISGALVLACVGTAMAQTDDFQCFKAKDTAKAFVKTSATVTDTYAGATVTDFKKPFLLCDSAQIAGGPART